MRLLTKSNRNPFLFSGLGKQMGELILKTMIMTRILSVFNLLKRVGFAVLFVATANTFAQHQAPIEWEQPRWANLTGWPGLPRIGTLRVIPMGDTLLFTGFRMAPNQVHDTLLVCSSFDNGQTFTPWIPITDGNTAVYGIWTGSAGRFYCFVNKDIPLPWAGWVLVSEDGGLTWSAPRAYRENRMYMGGFASGHDVMAKYVNYEHNDAQTRTIFSSDGGDTWSPPVIVDTAAFILMDLDQSIAFTRTKRLLIDQPAPSRHDRQMYVATGDSTGQNWTPFEVLPCEYYENWMCNAVMDILGDTASEAAGILGTFSDGISLDLWPLHYRTSDAGGDWESCVPMTEDPYVIPWSGTNVTLNIGVGKLWLVGWEHRSPEWGNWVMTRFSANHGRNWYPLQAIADSSIMLNALNGQIRGNRIDVYWDQGCNVQYPTDYRMVAGTITPDTIYPVIQIVIAPPDTVGVGSQQLFTIHASDNDTLSEARLIIEDRDGNTWRRILRHVGDDIYDTVWTVPDTGYYNYWLEAEDWWEQVTRLPDSGSFHFVTEGWTHADDNPLFPASFRVLLYPNPANTAPNLELSPDWFVRGSVEISVHNVLGQEVWRQKLTVPTASIALLDGNAATGVYLARVFSAQHSTTKKFVILK